MGWKRILPQKRPAAEGSVFCTMDSLTEEEKKILLSGCLMNFYQNEKESASDSY